MRSPNLLLTSLFAVLQLTSAAQGATSSVKHQHAQLLDTYDFVIAGGGTAGLTVGDRLTEAFPDSSLSPISSFYLTPDERADG